MITIKQLDRGRDNNFDQIRFIAATLVIFSHAYLVTGAFGREPLINAVGFTDLGEVGVKVFFTISGYLVTKSLYSQPTLGSFVWARVLRIFPALFVSVLFCALVIGPICTTLPLGEYLFNRVTLRFIWRLATLHNFSNVLPGTFGQNPYPAAINNPVWTLAAELLFYAVVLALGLILLIWKKQFNTILKALPVLIAVLVFFAGITYDAGYMHWVLSWAVLFGLGAFCYFFCRYIIISIPLFCGLLLTSIAFFYFKLPMLMWVYNITLVYGVFIFAYHPRLQVKGFHKLGDLSYGLYIYAFPIQQLVVAKIPGISITGVFFMAYIPALGLAALSWYFVEKPALKLKSRPSVKIP
ncbi:acyltransferase [Mucilaginibacter sp. ZT4R22]|uniref:Acyltransferase n=1 Tax=Mucilaginibacter pankratovii TaxID=2772110 RepID=A0ABR7WN85_9SPHI|nr:acyltransferase [Mucilaginibacter pankratovii]MBD1363618.1 acyltransferase [Mucilaginibacter pankratovii]